MEMLDLFKQLGHVTDVSFADTLLRKITNDFYYVLNLTKVPTTSIVARNHEQERDLLFNDTPTPSPSPTENATISSENSLNGKDYIYQAKLLKVPSEAKTVPQRIRLFDQPAKSRVGCSLPTSNLCTTEQLLMQLNYIKDTYDVPELESLIDTGVYYNEQKENFFAFTGEPLKGYTTIAIDGKYLVDTIVDYDQKLVNDLYKVTHYDGEHSCYLCGERKGVYCGAMKDPAWKLLTTTRKNELQHEGETFVRCFECEYAIMKGMYLLRQFTRVSRGKTRNLERVIIPCTTDKRIWQQLLRLREEHESDLRYYQVVERLYDRFARRGLSQFIEVNVLRTNRSYGVLSVDILSLENVRGLCAKENYERFLRENRWLPDTSMLDFYPDDLIEYKDDYKWRLMDRVKRYWLGYETKELWQHIQQVIHMKEKYVIRYQLWEDYRKYGEQGLLERILNHPAYIAGYLVKELGKLETKCLTMDIEDKLHQRFRYKESGRSEYIIHECRKIYNRYKTKFKEIDSAACAEIETLLEKPYHMIDDGVDYFTLGRYENTRKELTNYDKKDGRK